MKKNSPRMIYASVLMPTGDLISVPAMIGKDVPDNLTIHGFLKSWQNGINRSPKHREKIGIEKLEERCPLCGGHVFCNKQKPFYKWCSRFPDCKYDFKYIAEQEKSRVKT